VLAKGLPNKKLQLTMPRGIALPFVEPGATLDAWRLRALGPAG
jgi:hypothetical protein